jgi:2-keto-4-pentenoate hydratase/2-oxohepta-3-ene-1,7-dioic acid hydratase in catechol pathway
MQLMNLGPSGQERPVFQGSEGDFFDLTPLTDEIDGNFLAADGPARALDAATAGSLPRIDATGLRVGPPVLRPGAVICIGMNYAAHAAESGGPVPDTPVVFLKTPNTVIGPNDDIRIPRNSAKTDWEVELAVVIGRRASYLNAPEDADRFIAGYTVSNDVSERSFQLETSGGQWSKGKCCPTFNPMGPGLVLTDCIPDPQALRLSTKVNGELRQSSSTGDMIFPVRHLVWHLSQYMTLEPGYVINTGTPQGVALSGRFPYLRDRDLIELEIEQVGQQRQRVRK